MADIFTANENRYDGSMKYIRAGRSGILLPEISLGLWQNFGATTPFHHSRDIILHAFDNGIVSFDLANNYGVPYGSAEQTFGRVINSDLRLYRDELFIATKAGYDMWMGPYGNWCSRKSLIASLDQSLKRMCLDYVDVFYSHRFDPETPLEETLQALVDIVRQGKALYIGISRWPVEALDFAVKYLRSHDTPCLLYQNRLNILDQAVIEDGMLDFTKREGIGFMAFSTLAEGLLTGKYINGIPDGSRAAKGAHLKKDHITTEITAKIKKLAVIANERNESLTQMSTAWVLNHDSVTSVIAGCSSKQQLDEIIGAMNSPAFSLEQLYQISEAVK